MSYIWGTRHPMVRRQRYLDQQKALRVAKREKYYAKHGVYPFEVLTGNLIIKIVIAIPLAVLLLALCAKR